MRKFIHMAVLLAAFFFCRVPVQAQTVSEKRISENWKKNRKSDSLHKASKETANAKKNAPAIPKKIKKPVQ